jgi:hypothetical protein
MTYTTQSARRPSVTSPAAAVMLAMVKGADMRGLLKVTAELYGHSNRELIGRTGLDTLASLR